MSGLCPDYVRIGLHLVILVVPHNTAFKIICVISVVYKFVGSGVDMARNLLEKIMS
jgi:hypothetical protein